MTPNRYSFYPLNREVFLGRRAQSHPNTQMDRLEKTAKVKDELSEKNIVVTLGRPVSQLCTHGVPNNNDIFKLIGLANV